MSTIYFIISNWWWISVLLGVILGGLKILAKRTDWVWDDRIITLLIGLLRMSRGKEPVKRKG
jgi:Co/Zn/Cd efflux system component